MEKIGLLKMACFTFAFCTSIASPAQRFTEKKNPAPEKARLTTIVNFNGINGGNPHDSLIQGTDGHFYGTTEGGGANNNSNCAYGCGTVFKITAAGTLTNLYSFCAQTNCTDGFAPSGALVQFTDGDFYGMTAGGGANNNSICNYPGCGTVFKITAGGTLTILYSFCSQTNCADGYYPVGALVEAADGNLYGTTANGGAIGQGTVFKITSEGKLTTLHSFDGRDGSFPVGPLVQAAGGNLYGLTFYGGDYGGALGDGTMFKITAEGTLTSLHSFDVTDGQFPDGGLIQAPSGNFYGTTGDGGNNSSGTVFKITSGGKLTMLHTFDGTDGDFPVGALIRANDGNFYGTTQLGGANSYYGTVFQITTEGQFTTLHSFDLTDGQEPMAGLIQATNGTFYGTTYAGGPNNACTNPAGCGTIFRLSVGLSPFVTTSPTFGRVGAKVTILGNDLEGATSVTFNGTQASFTASSTYISATVPIGATSGTVEVTTPTRTLQSNIPFRVTK